MENWEFDNWEMAFFEDMFEDDVFEGLEPNVSETNSNSESPKRFASFSAQQIDKILENKHSKKTKQTTNWGVATFRGL